MKSQKKARKNKETYVLYEPIISLIFLISKLLLKNPLEFDQKVLIGLSALLITALILLIVAIIVIFYSKYTY